MWKRGSCQATTTATISMVDRIDESAECLRDGAWPHLRDAAYHGPLGDVVRALSPETEAEPAAILLSLLAAFGSAVLQPHVRISANDHQARLFVAIVGDTSSGAKGESWSIVEAVMKHADPDWVRDSLVGGFASGEALIANLSEDETGPGRLVVEREFATLIARARRDGSILSPILRAAWDGSPLENRRAQTAVVARDHHIGVVAHITPDELRRVLRSSEISNGFGNRFLYALVRRGTVMPFGGDLSTSRRADLGSTVAAALQQARPLGRLKFSDSARDVWVDFVNQVTRRPSPGLIGDLTARSRPQALRLALIYAAADGSEHITPDHIQAATAVWQFSDASVRVIFDTQTGDPLADRLLTVVSTAGDDGLSLSEQRSKLGHNYPSADLRYAGNLLEALGVAERVKRMGAGRPSEILRFTPGVKGALHDEGW
jgi:hypothetical protein